MQFAGFGVDAVPDTQVCSKLPTKCILLVPLLPPSQKHWLYPFHTVPYSLELLASAGAAAGFSCTPCLISFLSCSSPFVCSQSSPFHRLLVKPMSSLPLASVVAELEGYFVKFNVLQRDHVGWEKTMTDPLKNPYFQQLLSSPGGSHSSTSFPHSSFSLR